MARKVRFQLGEKPFQAIKAGLLFGRRVRSVFGSPSHLLGICIGCLHCGGVLAQKYRIDISSGEPLIMKLKPQIPYSL